MKSSVAIFACSLLLLTSCGIQHSIDQSNEKQDQLLTQIRQSNAKQDDLLQQIKDSNDKQENLLSQIKISNSKLDNVQNKLDSVIEVTKHLGDLEVELIKGIDITNNGVHLQIMVGALHEMLSPQNTEDIIIPARMMPYADTFGKEATPVELIKVIKTFLVDAEEGATDKDQRLQSRMISLTAAETLAGLAPQEKVEEIFSTQVDQQGEFQDVAYPFGALRYAFIRDAELSQVSADSSEPTVSTLQRAVEYANDMKYLSSLPYAAKLKVSIPDLGASITIDSKELKTLKAQALKHFLKLPQEEQDRPEVKALLDELRS